MIIIHDHLGRKQWVSQSHNGPCEGDPSAVDKTFRSKTPQMQIPVYIVMTNRYLGLQDTHISFTPLSREGKK